MTHRPIVHRFSDAASVAVNAADDLLKALLKLQANQDQVHLVITGGTVGIRTLAEMADNTLSHALDFDKLHIWWGDERFVDATSEDRNAVQAETALLQKLPFVSANIHAFPSSDQGLSLEAAATEFEKSFRSMAPHFDIVLCGMGPDGHIASLFPGKVHDAARDVIAEADSPKPPAQRLSFNYHVLNSASEVWFLVAGADKEAAVTIAFGDHPEQLPVGRVHGNAVTHWYVDETASTAVFGC